jgi:hypothetical protein
MLAFHFVFTYCAEFLSNFCSFLGFREAKETKKHRYIFSLLPFSFVFIW